METGSEVQFEKDTKEAKSCRMNGPRMATIQIEMGTD